MTSQQETTMSRPRIDRGHLMAPALTLFAALVIAGCGTTNQPVPSGAGLIEQPAPPPGIELAPDSARVDLSVPTFSNPTQITNPLFPVSSQASVLMLGHVDGKPFRTEVTLLPYTRLFDWNGQRVEVAVSQYVAYLDGQIQEVAYDYYAQADDGSVWYFGEEVQDFVDGSIATTEGTWIAGRDGPAAMIMPAQPRVGDVYRTENAPGLVFEQVTVLSTDEVLNGPLGEVQGGLIGRELHVDGATEDKFFAPGYGEFSTNAGGDLEALVLAVPTDAKSGEVPADLAAIGSGADAAFRAAQGGHWSDAATAVDEIRAAWDRYQTTDVPQPIVPLMSADLDRLASAMGDQDADGARRAALDVRQWSLDLELRYRPVPEIDQGRFGIWVERLGLDVAAGDAAMARGDVFSLDYVRDRIIYGLDAETAATINTQLGELQTATVADDLATMADATAALRETLAGMAATGQP